MKSKLIHRVILGATAAAAAAMAMLAVPAQAALQDRDLNGDNVVDAFYDTDLDITWLRDANVNGQMNWATAVAWAEGYSIAGYDDWRLPTSDTCWDVNCTGSEMGHLWYLELGNSAGGPMTNTGNFLHLESSAYWSGTTFASDPNGAWAFGMNVGDQLPVLKSNTYFAMAAHPGDVGAVPEPQTYALLLLGLAGVAFAAKRRRR